MSHRSGKVFALDGSLIGWFEYNGSVDVARTQIFATQDELADHWRMSQPDPCACDGEPIVLDLNDDPEWPDYRWDARACRSHRCILTNRVPPEIV